MLKNSSYVSLFEPLKMKIWYDVFGMIFHFCIKYDLIFTTVYHFATKLWSDIEFWSNLALQNKDWKLCPIFRQETKVSFAVYADWIIFSENQCIDPRNCGYFRDPRKTAPIAWWEAPAIFSWREQTTIQNVAKC